MLRLVPIVANGTQRFVAKLLGAWNAGDAVLPVDPRLPPAAARHLVATMRTDEPIVDGDALVVATSGTTGEPKGVVLTHAAVRAGAVATSARLGVDPATDRWLACLPLGHIGGLAVVTRALVGGVPLVVHDGFDRDAVQRSPAAEGVTLVSLVATALRRIDSSPFRAILVGGGPPPGDLPPNAIATYGMTETGSGVVYAGRPLDGVEVRTDTRTSEIFVRGPMLLRAYRDGTDPKDSDGWLGTGDLGHWDAARGELSVMGRASDLIITGGENVWPAAVESILARQATVDQVVVVGRPDPEWGERVVAVVVPCDPSTPPTLEAMRAAVADELGPWAAPRELELVSALPRTPLGKPRRR